MASITWFDITCSRCNVFITKSSEPPPEITYCGKCMVEILQAKLVLAGDLARAVRNNYDADWDMPNSVIIALERYEEKVDGIKRN
jgi:hypothetical protein